MAGTIFFVLVIRTIHKAIAQLHLANFDMWVLTATHYLIGMATQTSFGCCSLVMRPI